jgi:ABC-type transporter MlaC component
MHALARLVPLLLAALLAAAPAPVRAAEEAAALETAQSLVEGAHGALAAEGLTAEERDARLREAVADAFAFDIWERFLLGDRAEMFTEEERAAFRARLPGFLAHLYKSQFGKGLEAKPEILGTRPARRDILVRAEIPRADGRPLPVDWRIRDMGEAGHEVIDVMVGGVSFLVLKREEFGAILEERGVEGLLGYMHSHSI